MKQIVYILALLLVCFSVSAVSIGEFNINEDIDIYQTCDTCTYCNFTVVKYPNSSIMLNDVSAIRQGTYFYSTIKAGNITEQGTYRYCYDCGNADLNEVGCLTFEVFGLYRNDLTTETSWFNNDALNTTSTTGVLVWFFTFLLIVSLIVISEVTQIPVIALLSGLLSFFYGIMLYTQISAVIGVIYCVVSFMYIIRSVMMAKQ